MTFSLLPDCLAAWLRGTLKELEDVEAVAEQASTLAAAQQTANVWISSYPGRCDGYAAGFGRCIAAWPW